MAKGYRARAKQGQKHMRQVNRYWQAHCQVSVYWLENSGEVNGQQPENSGEKEGQPKKNLIKAVDSSLR